MSGVADAKRPAHAARLPTAVWALGGVSLLMDMSSEMIHGLLPVFLVAVLGASAATVGLIEGIAEATASITKLISGGLSDRLGRRKHLALLGYGLAAATKPLFALAATPLWVLAARFVDRVGKGIRGAPRDSLIADVTPAPQRGSAYGLRQSLDTIGGVAGPLIAALLMAASGDDYRLVFWIAVAPAFASVVVLALGVREPAPRIARAERLPLDVAELRRLGKSFWLVIMLTAVLALARYSEAFLLLRVEGLGLAAAATPLLLVTMNVVYALSAYPAGRLSDRLGRRFLFVAAGAAVYVAANLTLAFAQAVAVAFLGAALWGLHLGLTQGLLAGLVADTVQPSRRGAAFGIFHFTTGAALLPASLAAGIAWDALGPSAPFLLAAALVGVAVPGLALVMRRAPKPH
ncbi:MAG TPA: MFS transporter [Alphaproteobacteria bacterium]|nr:MFS transporter [Alphaproteobacteria bacterium]